MTRNRSPRPTPHTVPMDFISDEDLVFVDPLGVFTDGTPEPSDPEHDPVDVLFLETAEGVGASADMAQWGDHERPVIDLTDPGRVVVA
jgi:hypothetical protein